MISGQIGFGPQGISADLIATLEPEDLGSDKTPQIINPKAVLASEIQVANVPAPVLPAL